MKCQSKSRGPQLKTKFAVTKLFTLFLIAGFIGLIESTPVFAQSFASPVSYAVGSFPIDGALGDFNGDGKPDLAVANNSTSNISVLLGNGDGTFGVKTDYDVGQFAYGVVITDLNSDGKLDIVAETSIGLSEGSLETVTALFRPTSIICFRVWHNLSQFLQAISITILSLTSCSSTEAAPQCF
jgi:hypothetical protein